MSIFRIAQMTCMGCGHPQRCKYAVVGDVETAPACHSCGESTMWMSDITAMPSMAKQIVARWKHDAMEIVRQNFIHRVLFGVDLWAPGPGDTVYYGDPYDGIPPSYPNCRAHPFLSPAIDEMTTSITWDKLQEFLDSQGIDIDYGDTEEDE